MAIMQRQLLPASARVPQRSEHSSNPFEQHTQQMLFKQSVLTPHPAVSCRCQHTLSTACPPMQQKMVDTLLYVHHAWSNAGL
jgi:hypothetical protein